MAKAKGKRQTPRYVVGLMSGTSADGTEAVVIRAAGSGSNLRIKLVAHITCPFTAAFRKTVLHAALYGTVADVCRLNFLLGEQFAAAALKVIRKSGLGRRSMWAIGSHGQTLHHLPHPKHGSTLQVGEPAIIAELTGIQTVADFRVRDMAAGGQGAPLVPYVDWALFTHDKHPRILQNIGGIGNLTFLPPRATLTEVMAFDTGPGNMVIDAVVQKLSRGRMAYDRNGLWARKGSVSAPLLELLMKHPFLRLPPPKSTGREEFGQPFMDQLLRSARRLRLADADIVATATAFTASSISQACKRYVFTKLGKKQLGRVQMIVGGGGARNLTLMKMIGEAIAPATVLTHEDLGGSSVAKEAIAFAVLAHETLQGKPSNVPSATGAKRPVILGKIVPAGRVGLQ